MAVCSSISSHTVTKEPINRYVSGGDERLEFGVTGVSFGVDPKSGKKIDQSERPPSSDHPYPTLVDDLAGTKHAWVPGGKFELPDYPPEPAPLKLRRPLSAATHKPMAAPTQRTVPQVEEILRRWLIENRRLHEDRRLTLVRGLTSALRVPKDTTGVPLSLLDSHRAGASYFSIAESENFRTSKAAVTESTKAFRRPGESNVDFRAMAFSGGGALPELNLTTENPAAALGGDDEETFAAAVAKIRLDPDLNEAERWGLEYRMRVALKRVLKGRGAANELWGIPPPKSLSYKMDLLEARRASESANTKGTATGKTRLALSSAYVTAQQLQASWGRMLAAEQMKGGVPCLLYPLSDAEAAALQEAFGSLLFRAEGLVGQEPGQEPSRTLGYATTVDCFSIHTCALLFSSIYIRGTNVFRRHAIYLISLYAFISHIQVGKMQSISRASWTPSSTASPPAPPPPPSAARAPPRKACPRPCATRTSSRRASAA